MQHPLGRLYKVHLCFLNEVVCQAKDHCNRAKSPHAFSEQRWQGRDGPMKQAIQSPPAFPETKLATHQLQPTNNQPSNQQTKTNPPTNRPSTHPSIHPDNQSTSDPPACHSSPCPPPQLQLVCSIDWLVGWWVKRLLDCLLVGWLACQTHPPLIRTASQPSNQLSIQSTQPANQPTNQKQNVNHTRCNISLTMH